MDPLLSIPRCQLLFSLLRTTQVRMMVASLLSLAKKAFIRRWRMIRADWMICVVVGGEKRRGGFDGQHSSPSLELVVRRHWSFESPLSPVVSFLINCVLSSLPLRLLYPGKFLIMDNNAAAAGKRKKMSEDADAASASLFASLPETTWYHIVTYAAPPDVYNLCLSSVHFFHEVSISSEPPSLSKKSFAKAAKHSSCRRSKRLAGADTSKASKKNDAASSSSSSDEKQNLLATKLLRTSLISSLGHVLEKSKSGITLDDVLKMGELPEGSALIAGSTMVAACLGRYDWKGDVDVYCSAKGAPQVRSVRTYHFCCL